MSIWVVYKDNDSYLFSTAEKAYSYLIDRLSELELWVEDGELKEWYRKQADMLTQSYDKNKSLFMCRFGWAEEREVN